MVKRVANLGAASRRAADPLIRDGRVRVNDVVMTDPARDVQETDMITVDGTRLEVPERVAYAVYKPRGVLSTASDPHGRKVVTDLIDTDLRLYPVGRLDHDTSGLIILTNDGELANRLTHPRYEVPKTYVAEVEGKVTPAVTKRLSAGVKLDDGPTAPAQARIVSATNQASTIELTIHEGRNRQVRRMLEAVGHPVKRLERTALDTITLGGLTVGQGRRLSETELAGLSA